MHGFSPFLPPLLPPSGPHLSNHSPSPSSSRKIDPFLSTPPSLPPSLPPFSYLWNLTVTKRIELFGMKCAVGDLVTSNPLVLDQGPDLPNTSTNGEDQPLDGNEFQNTRFTQTHKEAIRQLTEEDVVSGAFSIAGERGVGGWQI